MNREDERKIATAWLGWRAGQSSLTNEVYMDFVQSYVRDDANFRELNIFEVLDVLVNAELIVRPRRPSRGTQGRAVKKERVSDSTPA